MKKNRIRALISLCCSLGLAWLSARNFMNMRIPEPILPGAGVTRTAMLSEYFPGIENTRGDTEVYFLKGEGSGGTALILGGSHPNEAASLVTAVCLIESGLTTQGCVIVIPRANNSGFSHNDPQEANPQRFTIPTPEGERWFRYGSRSTNPVDQWPDPEVYRHHPSGQKLSGAETRNLNRSYPGKADGSLTEKVAHAILRLMEREGVDFAVDIHEASLEYPVINAVVAHPLAFDLAGETVLYLQMEGLNYNLEPSPENFRGLSHREWGDHLGIPAILMESANPVQGRYHGRLTEDMVLLGKDKFYFEATRFGLLEVDYPEEGIPLWERVGRHVSALRILFGVWSETHPEKAVRVLGLPDFAQWKEKGVGAFLN